MRIIDKLFYKNDKQNSERKVSKLKIIGIIGVTISILLIVSSSNPYQDENSFTINKKEVIISDGLANKEVYDFTRFHDGIIPNNITQNNKKNKSI